MRKRGQGATYSCSSGKSTPRAVERTTWLGRGPTVAIARDFCWLKTRWAVRSRISGRVYFQLTTDLPLFRPRTNHLPGIATHSLALFGALCNIPGIAPGIGDMPLGEL
jgi:hypothetical protein